MVLELSTVEAAGSPLFRLGLRVAIVASSSESIITTELDVAVVPLDVPAATLFDEDLDPPEERDDLDITGAIAEIAIPEDDVLCASADVEVG